MRPHTASFGPTPPGPPPPRSTRARPGPLAPRNWPPVKWPLTLIRDNLRKHSLPTDGVEVVPRTPTGICVSIFRPDGEHLYVSSLGAIVALNEEMLSQRMWPILSESDLVLLTGLFELDGLGIEGATGCFRKLRERGVPTALDVGWDTAGWPPDHVEAIRCLLADTDIFLPNLLEAKAVGSGSTPEQIARSLSGMGPSQVVVKMGRDGAAAVAGSAYSRDAGFPQDVRDTTAAGEAFNAGYLYAYIKGLSPREALRLGNATASLFLANGMYPILEDVEALVGTGGASFWRDGAP